MENGPNFATIKNRTRSVKLTIYALLHSAHAVQTLLFGTEQRSELFLACSPYLTNTVRTVFVADMALYHY